MAVKHTIDENTPEIWDGIWQNPEMIVDATLKELSVYEQTQSWKLYTLLVDKYLGGWSEVNSIEVGAGSARHSNLAALKGASVTVLDYSPKAIDVARECFRVSGASGKFVGQDVFSLSDELRENFNFVWSFGTAEHFIGYQRDAFIKAHAELLKPGGLLVLAVPNKYALDYRIYMALAKHYSEWSFGLEIPFSYRELGNHLNTIGVKEIAFIIDHNPWFRWQVLDLAKRRMKSIYPLVHILYRIAGRVGFPEKLTNRLNYEAIIVGRKPG